MAGAQHRRTFVWVAFTFTVVLLLFLTLAGIAWSQPAKRSGSPKPAVSGEDSERVTSGPVLASVFMQRTLVGPAQVELCDVVTYTLFVTNTDTLTATNILVTDTMPSGFTPASRSASLGQLGPGQSASATFTFSATCSAVSGQSTATLTDAEGDSYVSVADLTLIPGAITLRKLPAVTPARVGDVVTWTVYVENTGYGRVSNVVVTDALGTGLAYVSGLTQASYSSMAVGAINTFTLSARVLSCANLDNLVTATWGCSGSICQTQNAKASIDLLLEQPELSFTPPSIVIDYCTGSGAFNMIVTNVGSGRAYTPTIAVDFGSLLLTSSSAPYSSGAFHLPDILAGNSYVLSFTLALPSPACGMAGQSGGMLYTPLYYDGCLNPYYLTPRSGSWSVGGSTPSLSLTKSGPDVANYDQQLTYALSVDSANVSGVVYITDVFQADCGYVLLDAGGGTVASDSTRITITWSTTSASWSRSLVFSPTGTCPALCACCGQSVINTLSATARDCRDCALYDSTSESTYIECAKVLASQAKQVGPVGTEGCTTRTFTNTFVFGSSFVVPPTWSGLILTDTLSHMDYVPGSVGVSISKGAESCSATFGIASTSPLVVRDISPNCGITLPGATLVITYQARLRNDLACSGGSFFDWSYLNLGASGNYWCGPCDNGVSYVGTFVDVAEPRLDVAISGVPGTVSACGTYTPRITLSRAGATPAYDARLRFPTTDHALVEVLSFAGATPVLTTTDSGGYTWYYGDAFATASSADVTLRVQRRCAAAGPLQAFIWWDNLCANDALYDDTCSASASASPQVLSCNPILYKFPEVIYASSDVVTWTLTAINSGAGTAYGVSISDVLGSDLRYLTSTITSTQGSADGVTPASSDHWVTWTNLTLLPGEKYIITFVAEVVGCTKLTNVVYGSQGCQDEVCESCPVRYSHVELPPTIMLNTNTVNTPIPTCVTRTITATVRNAGLLSVYTATITEELASAMHYVAGSTQYAIGTGSTPPTLGWISGGEPSGAPLGPLVWTYNQIPNLARLYPLQTVWVRYQVYVDCNFRGGLVSIYASYRDKCGTPQTTRESSYVAPADPPVMSVQKLGRNVTTASGFGSPVYAEPGNTLEWRVQVQNSSDTPALQTVVTDILPSNVTYVGASPAPSYQVGQVLTWNVGSLSSATWTAYVTTSVDAGECSPTDTSNDVSVQWGCPDTGCRQQITTRAYLRTRPLFDTPAFSTGVQPATLHQCGGLITITLTNNGPPAHSVTLTDTLPSGYVYAATVYASTTPSSYPGLGSTQPVWSWGAGTLPSGVTTLAFRVVNANAGGACLTPPGGNNSIVLAYDDANGCTATGPYSASGSGSVATASPALSISKSPATRSSTAGQVVSWTLRITNTSSTLAPGVLITDILASGFDNILASAGQYPGGTNSPNVLGNVISWSPAITLNAGQSWSAVVSATVLAAGVHTDTAQARGACDAGCTYASVEQSAYTTLLQRFSKEPQVQTGTIGSTLAFTFSAFLDAVDAVYQNVAFTDTLPTGLGYVSSVITYTFDADASGPGATTVVSSTPTVAPALYDSGHVVWRLGDLPGAVQVDGVITAVLQNLVSNQSGVRRTNSLSLTYRDGNQPYSYGSTANVDIVEPSVQLSKAVASSTGSSSNLDGNAWLTYTLLLTNTGTSVAYDVLVTDTMPSQLWVTAVGQGGISSTLGSTTRITWSLPEINVTPPAATMSLTYTARLLNASAGVTLTNYVTTSYTSLAGNPYPYLERTYTTTAQNAVNTRWLDTTKMVAPTSTASARLRIGDVLTYTIVNTVPAGLVAYWPYQWDRLDPGLRYVPGSFSIGGTLPGALDAVATHYTNVTYGHVVGNNVGGSNPNAGAYKTATSQDAVEWWMQTFANSSLISQTVVVTFSAQFTGVDRNGAQVSVNPDVTRVNTQELHWNVTDSGSFDAAAAQSRAASVSSYFARPTLGIAKLNTPADNAVVGAGAPITYYLLITNTTRAPAYDIVISDVLPSGIVYDGSALTYGAGAGAPTAVVSPAIAATGVVTWRVDALNGTQASPTGNKTMTLAIFTHVSDAITASLTLTNAAYVPYYDSQPGAGAQVGLSPSERTFSNGSDTGVHRTPGPAIAKAVQFGPPPTLTLGSLVTYTLSTPATPITATLYNVVVTDVLDGRLQIVDATAAGGTTPAAVWDGQLLTATFGSIAHDTQAYVTITARLAHLWPSAAGDANAGETVANTGYMTHATGGLLASNPVSSVVGEPSLLLQKSAESSSGSLTNLDGMALLTYTLRVTNTGSSPAYSIYLTDTLPAGISVTALYGGDSHGAPVVGPGTLTWHLDSLGNLPGSNTAAVWYTARVDHAATGGLLTNTVSLLYHSLTDTLTGVRPYAGGDELTVGTDVPSLEKSSDPPTLKVGDVVDYHLRLTIPAGLEGMGASSYLRDVLPAGVWYITGSETLTWAPVGVSVVNPARTSGQQGASQVITWTFGAPIASLQDQPTVVTLTFRAQAIGLRTDNGQAVCSPSPTLWSCTNAERSWMTIACRIK